MLYGTFFPTILERTELLLPFQVDLIFEVDIQSGNLLYPFIVSVFSVSVYCAGVQLFKLQECSRFQFSNGPSGDRIKTLRFKVERNCI